MVEFTHEEAKVKGEELRAWREAARLSQVELGKLLGVSAQQVYKWESGNAGIVHPRIMERALRDVARELAAGLEALGVEPKELLRDD